MEIWCDTAEADEVAYWDRIPLVTGFTTNSLLYKKAGSRQIGYLQRPRKPISIENMFNEHGVIPKVMGGTKRNEAWKQHVNHTCIFSPWNLWPEYKPEDIISVFAGRIMDTGRSPEGIIKKAKTKGCRVLWASTREVYNIRMAEDMGCDIITVPPDILRKYRDMNGLDLDELHKITVHEMLAAR